MSAKSFTNVCLVLKRSNYAETDRLLTLVSLENGKFSAIAKGARKLQSSNRANLEPGNLIEAFFIKTKAMPLLVQSKLTDSALGLSSNLNHFRRLNQILEIFDQLLVEEELDSNVFAQILAIRVAVLHGKQFAIIQDKIANLLEILGFAQKNKAFSSVSQLVTDIIEKPLKSFEYLSVS